MMRYIYTFLLCCAVPTLLSAQIKGSRMDSIINISNQRFESLDDEFARQNDKLSKDYDAFSKKLEQEHEAFVEKLEGTWGKGNGRTSDKVNWVEYSDDYKSRSIVDFDKGEAEIEVVLTPEEQNNPELVEKRVAQTLEQLLSSRGKNVEYESKLVPQREVSYTEIMDGLIDSKEYDVPVVTTPSVSNKDLADAVNNRETKAVAEIKRAAAVREKYNRELAAAIAKQAKPVVKQVVNPVVAAKPQTKQVAKPTNPGKQVKPKQKPTTTTTTTTTAPKPVTDKVVVATVKVPLKPDYLYTRAMKFKDDIARNAKRFNVDESLVYGVMETESRFNPTAKSYVPAFGLMQIVPKYAGRDAYKYLYGKDVLVSPSYLYEPDNNIEMGVAYLNILLTRYFKGVTDLKSRELCAIAAYNTGAGNVSRALSGHTNIYKSIDKINSMSYQQLYDYLRVRLPMQETRNYIHEVTTRRDKY